MSRLLEGDVGSGKTVVATIALLNAALSGRQAALMAPTEILANQHYQLISKLLGSYGFNIALLTGSRKSPQAADANIVIGTQALIQKNFKFHDLALVIVDEQHRFGVKQRQHLLDYQANERELTPHSCR
jgi:ATP-dependent DNA helicase RecG